LVAHLHFLPTQKPNKKMQKSYQANAPKTAVTMENRATADRTPAGNSTYPKGGASCSKDSFVVNQTLVFQIKFCGKNSRPSGSCKTLVAMLTDNTFQQKRMTI
jgi:hypothetical protein